MTGRFVPRHRRHGSWRPRLSPTLLEHELHSTVARSLPLAVALLSLAVTACDNDPVEPDPGPGPEIQLVRAPTVGRSHYSLGNTPTGGQGQPISGLSCIAGPAAYHIHAHVSLFVKGEQIGIPAGIGITNPVVLNGYVTFDPMKCFYEIHTHDASGIVHLHANAGQSRPLTLGRLFDLWGHSLTRTNVAGQAGRVVVYVDQQRFDGDLRGIVLADKTLVSLQVGSPLVAPPRYIIPTNP
jgi:hypothetical protein